jgi:hypothetical protein
MLNGHLLQNLCGSRLEQFQGTMSGLKDSYMALKQSVHPTSSELHELRGTVLSIQKGQWTPDTQLLDTDYSSSALKPVLDKREIFWKRDEITARIEALGVDLADGKFVCVPHHLSTLTLYFA